MDDRAAYEEASYEQAMAWGDEGKNLASEGAEALAALEAAEADLIESCPVCHGSSLVYDTFSPIPELTEEKCSNCQGSGWVFRSPIKLDKGEAC